MNATTPTSTRPDFPVLPQDAEAEGICLGAMLIDPQAVAAVRAIVQADHFFRPRHKLLADAIFCMADAGVPMELAAAISYLRQAALLERAGGEDYLVQLVEGVPSTATVEHYAREVLRQSRLREIIDAAERARQAAYAPGADPEALRSLLADAAAVAGDAQPSYLTAGEMIGRFPDQREVLVENVIRRGEQVNLISGPKSNKSWTVMHLAVAVATGGHWLGFACRPGRVLMVDFELHPGTFSRRLRAVLEALAVNLSDIGDRLAVQPLRGRHMDIHGLRRYLAGIGPGRFDVIFIDPLYRLFPPDMDENSNADIAGLFAELQSLAEGMNVGIVTVHHLSKGDQSGKIVTDLGSGGGSQSRAADAHLAIRPHAEPGAAVLDGVLRSFPPFEPLAMRWRFPLWELAPDLDPADLKRTARRPAAKPPAEPVPPEPAKPDYDAAGFVAAFLGPEPKSRGAIIASAVDAKLPERRAAGLLARAEDGGLAFRWRVGRGNKSFYANCPQPELTEAGHENN